MPGWAGAAVEVLTPVNHWARKTPTAMKTRIISTDTERALPSVGWPSMMSVCALRSGTPGTSSSTAAVIAVSTVLLPLSRQASPARSAARKEIAAAMT
ncbi:MAG: hypothetical protein QM765_08000 [Myxococcales bacterium]